MKKWIRASTNKPTVVHIDAVFEIFLDSLTEVAAATYKGITIPEGELMPADKDAIYTSQQYQDFQSFLESVEALLTDYYGLRIYYKNNSDYNSFYWGVLAKNSDETLIIDFDLTLRVSTHPAHRTEQSQAEKKKQKAAKNVATGGKKTKPLRKVVVVNDKEFASYFDAIVEVDSIIEDAIEKLTRKKK